ncbi:Exocyst complex component Sec10-like protein [Amanita muscaria]
MDKFATLEPVKLYSPSPTSRFLHRSPVVQVQEKQNQNALIGRLPTDLHLLILQHLPLPDVAVYARCSRSTSKIVQNDKIWEARWRPLAVVELALTSLLDDLEVKPSKQDSTPDEFGDFASGEDLNDFSPPTSLSFTFPSLPFDKDSYQVKFQRAHRLLRKLIPALSSPPHLVLSSLSNLLPSTCKSLRQQARVLRVLSLYLDPHIQPVRRSAELRSVLRSAMDRFDASLLSAFDAADGKGDEEVMREAAESSWDVWEGAIGFDGPRGPGDWEMGKVWAEKREIFYEHGKWNALDNVTKDNQLDFDAMDEFMSAVLSSISEHGSRAVRVFPPAAQVLVYFAERLANEVVGEYITSLLARSRELADHTFLRAVAASFREAWRMVDAIMQAASQRPDAGVKLTVAQDVVYRMFEVNMDEYLDEEVESVKASLDKICVAWDRQTGTDSSVSNLPSAASSEPARFLDAANPAALKRSVLASFTSVLLLPVTIVPRTVGAVGGAIGGAFRSGVTGSSGSGIGTSNPSRLARNGVEGETVFSIGDEDEDHAGVKKEKVVANGSSTHISNLDLMLSLDVALELVHADREALKRVEIFSGYPGHYGHRVRDTIEETFILMLQALGERHIAMGFARATERMKAYQPAEHQETTSVAPLLQFLELVHIGDTIQSMVQVYFEKELAPHIDKTDFLNAVVREKKKFENTLDDSVATGLNAGTELLMNQVEHIILTRTKPREYYPPEDTPLELGPTKGCTEAIQCLEMHCKLLKGSTSKEVLEVFHQEVGLRLISILQKHIKRQIISLNGGFQVIADLNTYYVFISSLKIPSITADFSHLKMLGHVYVVEDAKDLAQIVRDVQRYGGAYRPEDIYEFIQRRSDWKKIEKIVDKTMYNLSFKEDCVVC